MGPDGPASTAGIPGTGELFGGRYRVEHVVGRGAMGIVIAARHTSLRQRVAVKFLLPSAQLLPGASMRFLREAQAAAAIRSEHIARVLDVGSLDSGVPYIVMEHLEGRDLEKMLIKRGPLPLTDAVDYLLQACEALAEAHALGIVHRDLKPGNLFLTSGTDGAPLVKVLDFGLSTPLRDAMEGGKLTSTEMMLGSPCYMSPEQVRSLSDIDGRADIWALGVILHQLLTARFPFEAPTVPALFVRIANDAPTPLREHRPELPAELEAAILQCLEKDRSRRVESITELARLLMSFGSDSSLRSAERIAWIAVNPEVTASPSVIPPSMAAPNSQTATVRVAAPTDTRYEAPEQEGGLAAPADWPKPEPHGSSARVALENARAQAVRYGSSPPDALPSAGTGVGDVTEIRAAPAAGERVSSNAATSVTRVPPDSRTAVTTLFAGGFALFAAIALAATLWLRSAPPAAAPTTFSARVPSADQRSSAPTAAELAAPPLNTDVGSADGQAAPPGPTSLSHPGPDLPRPVRRRALPPPPAPLNSPATGGSKPPLTRLREKR